MCPNSELQCKGTYDTPAQTGMVILVLLRALARSSSTINTLDKGRYDRRVPEFSSVFFPLFFHFLISLIFFSSKSDANNMKAFLFFWPSIGCPDLGQFLFLPLSFFKKKRKIELKVIP